MSSQRSVFKHDLFGKPVPTFPDHALGPRVIAAHTKTRRRLSSARGFRNSCDDGLMQVICPTDQAKPNTLSRRMSGEASVCASESGSEARLVKRLLDAGAADAPFPAPYFKTPPELCCPGNGLLNSSVVGRNESRNLRTELPLVGVTSWLPELLPGDGGVDVSLPGKG